MDCEKVGKLISKLRKEQNMTQKQLASRLNLSDKTISKWECGLGCPDVCFLNDLSNIFHVNIEKLLLGDLSPKDTDGGNMKRVKFYICPECGNLITSTSDTEVTCCGRKLTAQKPQKADEEHKIDVSFVEDDFYITFHHPMTKQHYLMFLAYVTCDRMILTKLYPEQSPEVRFPRLRGGKFYYYCNRDGLWME
ncbi:MAG: helix-turn-helix domain-containing protein [Clostridiales bacterium]|nr:helix-turn-helix domain-containing protein [Clostridiales bacterium]